MGIKIAIMVRAETAERCTGKGCLRSFFARTESFHRYQGVDVELIGFFHSGGDLEHKLQRMKKAGVQVIHVSTCTRGKDPNYHDLVARIAQDFDVIGYTHGTADSEKVSTLMVTGKFI